MTSASLLDLYRQILIGAGFTPHVDPDGDLAFAIAEHSCYISVDKHERALFRLVMLNFLTIESDDHARRIEAACLEAIKQTPVVKIYPTASHVSAVVELLCDPPDSVWRVFRVPCSCCSRLSPGSSNYWPPVNRRSRTTAYSMGRRSPGVSVSVISTTRSSTGSTRS